MNNYVNDNYLYECQNKLGIMSKNLNFNTSSIEVIDTMEEIYKYLKIISYSFYDKNLSMMNDSYKYLIYQLYDILDNISNTLYIIPKDSLYNYEKNINKKNINTLNEEELLEFIIHKVYDIFQNEYTNLNSNNFKDFDLTNKCPKLSYIVFQVCERYHIKCDIVKLKAGFSDDLYDGNRFHYFNIVQINSKKYIIDCSYKQFFKIKTNIIEALGVPLYDTPLLGCFMLMDEERRKVSQELLKKCFISLTPENLKNYLDGFTISFRNGLFYEKTNDLSYTTSYNEEDYLKLLYSDISLIDYEGKEVLGQQSKPLNNPEFTFKKR